MSDDIKWFDHPDGSAAKPHQWYYHEEPCDILGIGLRNGKIVVHRLKTKSGVTHEVLWKNGELPGVTYEIFDHEPGRA